MELMRGPKMGWTLWGLSGMWPRAAREEGGHPSHGLILSIVAERNISYPRYNRIVKSAGLKWSPRTPCGVSGTTRGSEAV